MGEPVFLSTRMPNGRFRVVEAHCGDPQFELDRLELGDRVAFWLRAEPDDWAWHWRNAQSA